MSIKPDCFAFKSNNLYNGCNALDKLYCRREECKFYKTKEEHEAIKRKIECDIYEK